MDAHFVEQRQVEIGQRRRFGVFEVAPAFYPGGRTASDKDWQIRMVVHVGVANAAAIKIKRMVEQRAVAFRRRL